MLNVPNVKIRIPSEWVDEALIREDWENEEGFEAMRDLDWVDGEERERFDGGVDAFVHCVKG